MILYLVYKSQHTGHYLKHTKTICIDYLIQKLLSSASSKNMASIRFWSFLLPLVLVTLSSMTSDTRVEGARNLLQSTLPLPPILPNLPLPLPPLPQPELPPLPTLPKPQVPIPDVPVIPDIPKVPGIPVPELPAVPT